MINLRRLALVSGVAVISIVAFSVKVQADTTANVEFSGTVEKLCTVLDITPLSMSVVNTHQINSRGTLTVSCNTGVKLTIASIGENGSDLTNGNFHEDISFVKAEVLNGPVTVVEAETSPNQTRNNWIQNQVGTASTEQTSPNNVKYDVVLRMASEDKNLALGYYNIRIALTLAPQ